MEDFDEANQQLIRDLAATHLMLREAFANLPALPITIPLMEEGGLAETTEALANAAESMHDLPGHPMVIQGLVQASYHWITGVYVAMTYAASKSRGALLGARFAIAMARADLDVATMAHSGQFPTIVDLMVNDDDPESSTED